MKCRQFFECVEMISQINWPNNLKSYLISDFVSKFVRKISVLGMKKLLLFFISIIFICNCVNAEMVHITGDSYINILSNDSNYGSLDYLSLGYSSSERQIGIMKFTIPKTHELPEQIVNVTLHLRTKTMQSSLLIAQTSNEWDEQTITWNNRPFTDTHISSTDCPIIGTYSENTYNLFNLSSIVKEPGTYSIAMHPTYGNWVGFFTKENESYFPYITYDILPPSDTYQYNNYTDNQIKSFTVNESDCIRFNVSLPDSRNITSYSWEVNKQKQSNTSDYFDFTVPSGTLGNPQSEIWEIHVDATYSNTTVVSKEWLISSLSIYEAPDWIDFFVDMDSTYRTVYDSDPWGRPVADYTYTDTNLIPNGYLTGTNSGHSIYLKDNDFTITNGTFIFKIQSRSSVETIGFEIYDIDDHLWGLCRSSYDEHDYFRVVSGAYIPISKRWLGQAPGAHPWKYYNYQWIEMKMIKTPNGYYYLYEDNKLLSYSFGHVPTEYIKNADYLNIYANGDIGLDCIQVYENQYLFPEANISYKNHTQYWYLDNPSNGYIRPINTTGIDIYGKNVTLRQIANQIDDPGVISYNVSTRTAVVKTNITFEDGSQFIMNGETLEFDTSFGYLYFTSKVGVELNISNSTISATNSPMIWNFASSVSQQATNPWLAVTNEGHERYSSARIFDFRGYIDFNNVVINNTANMFLDAPFAVNMENIVFANMSNSGFGKYDLRTTYENYNQKIRQSQGEKGLWIVPRLDMDIFNINNVTFLRSRGASLNIIGGEWIQNSTTIQNSDLREVNISGMKAYKYEYYITYKDKNESSMLSLLNCQYDEESISINGYLRNTGAREYNEAEVRSKYFFRVRTVNSSSSVSDAIISIESSENAIPAENLYSYKEIISDSYGPGTGGVENYLNNSEHPEYYYTYSGGYYSRWFNALPTGNITTNSTGDTSYDDNSTLVLVDRIYSNETGTFGYEDITYNLTITADGYETFVLENINPNSSWYDENGKGILLVVNLDDMTYSWETPFTSKHDLFSIDSYSVEYGSNDYVDSFQTFTITTNKFAEFINTSIDGVQVLSNSNVDSASYTMIDVEEGTHIVNMTAYGGENVVSHEWKWVALNEGQEPNKTVVIAV